MAAVTSVLAGVVVVVIMAPHLGAALSCYSCYTSRGVRPKCDDPFSARGGDLLVDCDTVKTPGTMGDAFCKKVKHRDVAGDRSLTVTRTCAWATNQTTVCDKEQPESERLGLKLLHCSACNMDGCNGSGALLPTVALCLSLLPLLCA